MAGGGLWGPDILPVGNRLLNATLNALQESAFDVCEETIIMTDR